MPRQPWKVAERWEGGGGGGNPTHFPRHFSGHLHYGVGVRGRLTITDLCGEKQEEKKRKVGASLVLKESRGAGRERDSDTFCRPAN